LTVSLTLLPAARPLPELEPTVTKPGAFNLIDQFRPEPPVFEMWNDLDAGLSPLERLKLMEVVSTASTGGTSEVVRATLSDWGLPLMALPPLTASSEIEPEYEPEPNEDEVTWTVNVVLPLVRVAEAGETTNQFELVVVVAVGVMVTPFAQLPTTAAVKV
jgi:hypothetical protein